MMMDELSEDLLTFEEFEEKLQIGRTTAYRLLQSSDIKAFKIGRYWKIPRAAVSEYISRKSNLKFY
ncbi:MAG: helix-turn-helix domain-containing protein [Lachnospiraceae bacterium]|nr:helix-turn-helix domain-containing protein [Lachnospiraceae bacterium]